MDARGGPAPQVRLDGLREDPSGLDRRALVDRLGEHAHREEVLGAHRDQEAGGPEE